MILDVGCGNRPRGDVNLDSTTRDVPNFVLGNALELPFDDGEFDTVFSSGLSLWTTSNLKEDLIRAFMEASRVAKIQVVMEYSYYGNHPTWITYHPHKAYNFIKKSFPGIKLTISERQKMHLPIKWFFNIFGIRITTFVMFRILHTSLNVKFKLCLLGPRSCRKYPEVKITTLERS